MSNLYIITEETLRGIADAVKQKRHLESISVKDLRDEILTIQGDTFKFLVTAEYPKVIFEKVEKGVHVPEMVMSLYLDDEEGYAEND